MKNKAFKRLIYGLTACVLSFSLLSFKIHNEPPQRDTTSATGYRLKTIIVDAGHGGVKAGASGSFSLEKNVTLQIAFKLQKAIEKELNDVKVVMTRTNDDDVSLQKRSDIANNNKGDLFISIHCNSLPDHITYSHGRKIRVQDHSGKGVLLLVYGFHRTKEEERAIKENLVESGDQEMNSGLDPNDPTSIILLNTYKTKYRKQSIRLADLINREFIDGDGRRSEGIREQGVLVLCHTAMPSVLVETGYINNAEEEEYLNSEQGQNEIVNSIVRAVKQYKREVEQSNQ